MKSTIKIITLFLCFILLANTFAFMFSANAEETGSGIMYGDVNSDNAVNSKDTLMLKRFLASWEVTIDNNAADVTADGIINSKDTLLLKKFLAGWDVVLGPSNTTTEISTTVGTTTVPTTAEITTASTTQNAYAQNTYTMGAMAENMNLVGRSVPVNDYVYLDMTASGIEFQANCVGDVTLGLKWSSSDGMIGVIIDDDYANMQEITVLYYLRKVTIATGLKAGLHKFRIVKLNEFNIYSGGTYIRLEKVILNGTIAEKPAQKELKIEFYGDSLTCGYGNLCPDTTQQYPLQAYQDGYKTFAAYSAQALNAELDVCAGSGYGLCYSNGGSKTQTLANLWNKALPMNPDVQAYAEWDFSRFDADIVVITIGTNDINYAQGSQTTITNEEFKTAATELINNIRSKNPDCYIIWLGGIAGKMRNSYADLDSVLTEMDQTDDMLWYHGDFTARQSGGNNHPNVAQHQLIAADLVQRIKQDLGSFIDFE